MVPTVALVLCGAIHLAFGAPVPEPEIIGEISSYQQVGDVIKGEFSRLHHDGSITKAVAFGDTQQGLQYKTYQIDPVGNVKALDNQPPVQKISSEGGAPGGSFIQKPPGAPGPDLAHDPAAPLFGNPFWSFFK